MRLYNRFLIDFISNAPTAHIFSHSLIYLGTPYVLIENTLKFIATPIKDVLDLDDVVGYYENALEVLHKNKLYDLNYTTVNTRIWNYPIDDNKYSSEKFESLAKLDDLSHMKVPVEVPPIVSVGDFTSESGDVLFAPIVKTIGETIDGVDIIAEVRTCERRVYAVLVPPDFGPSTPLFYANVIDRVKNPVLRTLIEKYLDGLEYPEPYRVNVKKGESWIGKVVSVGMMRGKIVKLLLHEHLDTYSNGCDPIELEHISV